MPKSAREPKLPLSSSQAAEPKPPLVCESPMKSALVVDSAPAKPAAKSRAGTRGLIPPRIGPWPCSVKGPRPLSAGGDPAYPLIMPILTAFLLLAAWAGAGELVRLPSLEVGVHPSLVPALAEPSSPTPQLLLDRAEVMLGHVMEGTLPAHLGD